MSSKVKSKLKSPVKLAVVTSSRADYGILKPLMNAIRSNKNCHLINFITGSHLKVNAGHTFKQIEADGFTCDFKISSKVSVTNAGNINNGISTLIKQFSIAFDVSKPNYIIVLGDRYEIFAASIAAYVLQIPIAHIHGGEVTAGAFDEGFRHSITKFASLHFVTCDVYKKRVIQLGENPDTVYNVGALAVDNLLQTTLLGKSALEKELGISFNENAALITYHPVTLEKNTSVKHLKNLFKALEAYPEMTLIINVSNADTDGDLLNLEIERFVNARKNAVLIPSLGTTRFLSTLNVVSMMIGNSSAGLIEMPFFKKPSINIGDRQLGRFKPESVIDCDTSVEAIQEGISKGLSKSFRKKISKMKYPFGDGNTASKILQVILSTNSVSLKKEFFDLN